jgi:hypothetical protein
MSTLIIRKKSLKTWLHIDSVLGSFIISKFYFSADNLTFQIVEQGLAKRLIYNVEDITLYDDVNGGGAETFSTITELSLRLEELKYPAFQRDGEITSIAGFIEAGTNVTITGSGTLDDPYVINATGGGGGSQTLQQVLGEGGRGVRFTPNNSDDAVFELADRGKVVLKRGNGDFFLNAGIFEVGDELIFEAILDNWGGGVSFDLDTQIFVNGVDVQGGAVGISSNQRGYLFLSEIVSGVEYWIYRVISNVIEEITVDATPTNGSENPVSSNGVFDALATKENTITAGTTAQYYRGDKTFQTLDKTAVGLANVDNTSDANKPISTATQTALNNRTANAVKRAVASSPVTGVTIEAILSSDEIVGNFFSTNDIMQLVTARFIKTGTLGTCTYRVRINTVNSLSGAVTIATLNNAGIYAKIGNRTFTITGGNLRGYNFTDNGISSGQDTGSASLAEASTAYNPANSIFILTTAQLANGGDSTVLRELLITN